MTGAAGQAGAGQAGAETKGAGLPVGAVIRCPIGWIDIRVDGAAVTQLHWRRIEPGVMLSSPLGQEARRQVSAYLEGRLRNFDLPLAMPGSDFSRAVWDLLVRIPYGETRRYGDLATLMGRHDYSDARAVGTACGLNPIAIIIPCHRVVGAAALGGYSSDLGDAAKRFLLDLEKGQGRLF